MNSSFISFEKFTGDPFEDLNPGDEAKGAVNVLQWAYDAYGDSVIYACSFGAESMVLLDLISKIKKDAAIVFLDTGVHFKETHELIDQIKMRYPGLWIQMKTPALTLEKQARQYGPELWKTRPDLCCFLRKIKPMEEVLDGVPAWISGLRREQSATRKDIGFVNKDERFKSVKICPLIYWTWDDVWEYIRASGLPYNPLHDKGYPSIGCEPCTSPAADPANSRSGRWAGLHKTECGLHLQAKKPDKA
jgi:phosphoadenosine phosphosulfate reductase